VDVDTPGKVVPVVSDAREDDEPERGAEESPTSSVLEVSELVSVTS